MKVAGLSSMHIAKAQPQVITALETKKRKVNLCSSTK